MEKRLREKLAEGKFGNVSETHSRRMKAIRGRGNRSTELLFRLALVRAGIKGWRLNPKDVTGKPDFFFLTEKLAVFTDGCFWHGCPRCGHVPKANNPFWAAKIQRNRERNIEKVAALAATGFRSIRFWEHELKEDMAGCVARVRALIAEAS